MFPSWILIMLSAGAPLSPDGHLGALALGPCHLEGLSEEVRCGSYRVFEDRTGRAGRTLDLQVAVLPARSRRPERDPLFVLAGGPGQGARGYAALAEHVFDGVRRNRDIVLVDLRGTGDSNPLDCPGWADPLDSLAEDAWVEIARRCLASLDADPRLYTSEPAMDDLDDIRAALGYERINLWGGSYGTRAALVYARRHAVRVRSVVLDGAAPFGLRTPLYNARGAQRALERLLEDCRAAPSCAARFPALEERLDGLLERLGRGPIQASIRHPVTGEPRQISISRAAFASGLRGFLYVPRHAALVPWIVERAAAGDFGPFTALALETLGWSTDTMSLGVTLSVVCSEDVSRLRESDVGPAVEGTFLGRSEIDQWRALCALWPAGPLPEGADRMVPLEIPALILSGDLDPVTPPVWGEAMAAEFPGSLHLIVPGVAHNTSAAGCMPELIASFIAAGHPNDLDIGCLAKLARPPFVESFAGPSP